MTDDFVRSRQVARDYAEERGSTMARMMRASANAIGANISIGRWRQSIGRSEIDFTANPNPRQRAPNRTFTTIAEITPIAIKA